MAVASPKNLPKSDNTCDGATIQTYLTTVTGSLDDPGYTIFALPDKRYLEEPPDNRPLCNLSHACVLYIGVNQLDFTQPKTFSAPFYVDPSSYNGHNAVPTPTMAPTASSTGSEWALIPIVLALLLGLGLLMRRRRAAS